MRPNLILSEYYLVSRPLDDLLSLFTLETADLVRVTEETLNGKLHFLCSVTFTFTIKKTLSNI